jgi:hypothetical protein
MREMLRGKLFEKSFPHPSKILNKYINNLRSVIKLASYIVQTALKRHSISNGITLALFLLQEKRHIMDASPRDHSSRRFGKGTHVGGMNFVALVG